MGALGLGLFWFGYWVAFYGYDQLQGGNNSFLSLGVPGKFTNAAKDSPGGAQAAANSAASQVLNSISSAQATQLQQAAPGGKNYPGGTGQVSAGGGVTVLYDAAGTPHCMDANGNTVPCPAGTPTFAAG